MLSVKIREQRNANMGGCDAPIANLFKPLLELSFLHSLHFSFSHIVTRN